MTLEMGDDRELTLLHGTVIGRGQEGRTILFELLTSDLMLEFPVELFDEELSHYGQPVSCFVMARSDGFRYMHFEARPAGMNPDLPEIERLLSRVG